MNLLGIDFEDWFHPELIQKVLTNEEKKPKVIKGIDKIIDWLNKVDISCLPVVNDEHEVIGIVSWRDLVRHAHFK